MDSEYNMIRMEKLYIKDFFDLMNMMVGGRRVFMKDSLEITFMMDLEL